MTDLVHWVLLIAVSWDYVLYAGTFFCSEIIAERDKSSVQDKSNVHPTIHPFIHLLPFSWSWVQGGWGVWFPPIVGTHSSVPFLKEEDQHPNLPMPDVHAMSYMHVNRTASRALWNSEQISSTPRALPLRSFITTSETSATVMKESSPKSPDSASHWEVWWWD